MNYLLMLLIIELKIERMNDNKIKVIPSIILYKYTCIYFVR